MEVHVRLSVRWMIALDSGSFELAQHLRRLATVRLIQVHGATCRSVWLKQPSQDVDVPYLSRIGSRDPYAVMGARGHQPFGFKLPQRFSYRREANIQPPGQINLVQSRS